MHRTDKYWQYSSAIWPVWLNGWVSVYELSSCGFEFCCCHLKVKYLFLMQSFVFERIVYKRILKPKQNFSKILTNFNKINLHSTT